MQINILTSAVPRQLHGAATKGSLSLDQPRWKFNFKKCGVREQVKRNYSSFLAPKKRERKIPLSSMSQIVTFLHVLLLSLFVMCNIKHRTDTLKRNDSQNETINSSFPFPAFFYFSAFRFYRLNTFS
jgi:hypothetical protein